MTAHDQQPSVEVNSGQLASHSNADTHYISYEETKKILTPFAFEINKQLFGLPLAVPWKRAMSLLIDLMLIAMLAETPGELLALIAAITFYQLGQKKRANGKRGIRRAFLRLLGAFIMFIMVLSYISPMLTNLLNDDKKSSPVGSHNGVVTLAEDADLSQSLALGIITTKSYNTVAQSKCKEQQCWYEVITPLLDDYIQANITSEQMTPLLEGLVDELELTTQQKAKLTTQLVQYYQTHSKVQQTVADEGPVEQVRQTQSGKISQSEKSLKQQISDNSQEIAIKRNAKENDDSVIYKGVEWLKGFIEDLGLSFGWAALYFSVLTARWRGQTPGKKLLKIKVVQLDGTPLSVWDSFGRYGGYGAGLATGLMGFLQIYWDANRQCIHDKISSTVVIDLKKLDQEQAKLSENL